MFRFLADENFSHEILRGLILRLPTLDTTTVQDEGLARADDPTVLAWAADHGRIVLTHDWATMPRFAYQRVANRQVMPGVFVVPGRLQVGAAVNELQFIIECSQPDEWVDRLVRLPL